MRAASPMGCCDYVEVVEVATARGSRGSSQGGSGGSLERLRSPLTHSKTEILYEFSTFYLENSKFS